jgi:hypothetical protein
MASPLPPGWRRADSASARERALPRGGQGDVERMDEAPVPDSGWPIRDRWRIKIGARAQVETNRRAEAYGRIRFAPTSARVVLLQVRGMGGTIRLARE